MKILVFPKDPNPYQELLYSPLRKQGLTISYLQPFGNSHSLWILIFIIPQIIYFRTKGYSIFHLHWLYPFYFPFMNNFFTRLIFTIYTPLIMLFIKLIGFKFVWTVHNLKSHEKQFLSDKYISILLSRLSDAKIVHSKKIIKLMSGLGYSTENTYIIPHGNYIGFYTNTVSRSEARKKFGIGSQDLVFLFFGLIRPYKGIPEMIETFSYLMEKDSNIKLFIAGQCLDRNLEKLIKTAQEKYHAQVVVDLKHIAKEKVQYYFNIADAVVIPFRNITASGSAILAFSFGKPIIAPLIGNIVDFPRSTGVYYNPKDQDRLQNAMLECLKQKNELPQKGKSAYRYAKSLSWEESAKNTYMLYKQLFSNKSTIKTRQ